MTNYPHTTPNPGATLWFTGLLKLCKCRSLLAIYTDGKTEYATCSDCKVTYALCENKWKRKKLSKQAK